MSTTNLSAQRLIDQLGLLPHPEGGYYRETYRSKAKVSVQAGCRDACTAIYYLLGGNDYSAWHRIASDELWHFYAGSALSIHVLDDQNGLRTIKLGDSLRDPDCVFQAVVPAGCWFAAESAPDRFALVGCTVAPGFEFSEFELADAQALIRQHPAHADLIRRLASTPHYPGKSKPSANTPPKTAKPMPSPVARIVRR